MQGRQRILVLCLLLRLHTAGSFSGDYGHFETRGRKMPFSSGKPTFIYRHVQNIDKGADLSGIEMQRSRSNEPLFSKYVDQSRPHPAMIVKSTFPRISNDRSSHFVTSDDQRSETENLPIPEDDLISVAMQMDVKKMNVTLLRIFREGIAAALGLMPQQVHINHLNVKKNCIEFYISPMNRESGILDPIPSEEVIQSLNVNMMHQSLSEFGITQVTPEKNALHGDHGRDGLWNKEGVYTVVIFLTAFVIIITCLMFLYRLKEKLQFQINQDKQQHQHINLGSIPVQQPQPEVKIANSMVQPGSTSGAVSVNIDPQGRSTPEAKPYVASGPSPFKMKPACLQESRSSSLKYREEQVRWQVSRRCCWKTAGSWHSASIIQCQSSDGKSKACTSCEVWEYQSSYSDGVKCQPFQTELLAFFKKVIKAFGCPQSFSTVQVQALCAAEDNCSYWNSDKDVVESWAASSKIRANNKRGSNVSLTLDMSTLGNVESFSVAPTPREKIFLEYLQTASRVLTRLQLKEIVASAQSFQAEFMEIPMNFVNPKELSIPCHGTKNRYKTILPNPHSRVCLIPKSQDEPVSSTYINANYIRGYGGQQKAYIATQGPMINTVNDFWRMVWQEDCPVIVMITKLKEKNEKCVLYWPEKRGIYGKVEVLVNSITECEHYVIRDLTLKNEGKSQNIKHYWYKSWPDHKTPDSAQPLLQLMLKVEETRQKSPGRGPIVVHCSAGIGRTGCFIAITIGCHQLRNEGVVDILSIVCQLRVDRGGMIQTSEQYGFVHHALSLYDSEISPDTSQ